MKKDFKEVLGDYDQKVEPLKLEKEKINSEIQGLSVFESDQALGRKLRVLEHWAEEAIVSEDEKRMKSLETDLARVKEELVKRNKIINEDLPLLRKRSEELDKEIAKIGETLANEAVRVMYDEWYRRLTEALDFIEDAFKRLAEFRQKVGITGFLPTHVFQIDGAHDFDLANRLANWVPRMRS